MSRCIRLPLLGGAGLLALVLAAAPAGVTLDGGGLTIGPNAAAARSGDDGGGGHGGGHGGDDHGGNSGSGHGGNSGSGSGGGSSGGHHDNNDDHGRHGRGSDDVGFDDHGRHGRGVDDRGFDDHGRHGADDVGFDDRGGDRFHRGGDAYVVPGGGAVPMGVLARQGGADLTYGQEQEAIARGWR